MLTSFVWWCLENGDPFGSKGEEGKSPLVQAMFGRFISSLNGFWKAIFQCHVPTFIMSRILGRMPFVKVTR